MPHAAERPRATVEDYRALPDDVRAELLDGVLYVTPSPQTPHQRTVPRVWARLQAYGSVHRAGEAFLAPYDVYLPTGDVVQPDVLFVRAANAGIVQDWIHGAPDLVVEVLSPMHAERDRFVKRRRYARGGVAEYWIVDPAERSVEVLRLEGGRYHPAGYFVGDEVLVSPTLEGFETPLASLFEG